MLGNKNTNKKTVMSGVGIALLLCALMVGMTMTNLVQTDAPQVESELAVASEESDDYFALPDVYEPAQYEYDETSELEGMRSMKQKAFRLDNGDTTLITSTEPLHYMSSVGSWEQIDLNIMATANGWEVKENLYEASFAPEFQNGVSVVVNQNVDPIITGINPSVVTLDESGTMPMAYMTTPATEGTSVGGNVIRYPIAEGFDLDYTVESIQLKQNLVIRERPVLDESVAYFGVTEQMRLPVGYGLFLGDDILREDVTQTQDELTIRNLETGEVLATIPEPVVTESDSTAPRYTGTYFVQVYGEIVVLTTAVDADWLMDEERQFPLAIDPSIKVMRAGGGDCYVGYGRCYNSIRGDLQRNSYRIYYTPWNKVTFTSANALPTGATIEKIDWRQYYNYGYNYAPSGSNMKIVVMEKCGTQSAYQNLIASRSCNGAMTNLATGSSGSAQNYKMISSAWNSATAATHSFGTGWKTATLCSTATACAATTGSHNYVANALANGGSVGMSSNAPYSSTVYYYTYSSGSRASYMQVTYSGGSDTTPPIDGFVPYTGITSYKSGERTFFTTLSDNGGIDTTSTGAPHLHYSINNGTYTAVKATSIGTCGSSATECDFRATTGSISTGDYVKYFWAYQDGASTPNLGTSPSGGTGSPNSASPGSSTYWFFVDDVDNAGTDRKFTVTTTDVRAYSTSSTAKTFDRQMTYYDNSDEYVFEFDTSDCGTGSNSCFYTSSYYYWSQWEMQWTTSPPSGYNGFGGTVSGSMKMHSQDAGGYLTISADDGPGMNLIYLYDSSSNKWAMVGLGTDTGIEQTMASGTTAAKRSTYGNTAGHLVDIPADISGSFGKFDWGGVYSSSKANWMCAGTNGFYYFFRSTSSNPSCNTGYYYVYSTYYRYSGFALGTGSGGVMAGTGSIIYKSAKVAPEPDTTAPEIDHNAMRDSHSRDRTFTFTIADGGEPPSGLKTSVADGPMMWYRITDADGTVNGWNSKVLSPSKARTACETATCDWSTTLEDLERGSEVEYYVTATDKSIASTGVNTNNTSSAGWSFEVGDPNKVFVVEWHDVGYTNTYTCTYQVLMYDVTNEIEFQYDTGCKATYDYATVGYQDMTRNNGATLRSAAGYLNGANPHSVNYRIGTDSGGHSSETFDLGMTELPSYDTAITGANNGRPYGYYCYSAYYWNTYKPACNANIDLPDGFTFEYFGTEYNGSDSKNRVHISRFGNMYFKADGSTALERSLYATSNMPDLPNKGTYAMPGTIAPWWGYYSAYYCYDNTALDCSVRTRLIPFEGKGTDVSADITQPTTWSLIDSPVRINPSSASGYLSIGDDLTIEPGVVIQVAAGKGLSFDGSCSTFDAEGNDTDHILFEGLQGASWKGLAFTGACSTGTDDRHTLSYVDFANTTDAAIAAGSRHGSSPVSNANVGNFTMDHVTFTNVDSAFEHGSGQGTVVSMSDFEVNDASSACFDFAEDSEVTLRDGKMEDCNSNGNSAGGAILNVAGSTGGSLILENVEIVDSLVNLINVDFESVWISNVTATSASSQIGTVVTSAGDGADSSFYVFNMTATGYVTSAIHALDTLSMEDVDWGTASISIAPGGTSSTSAGPSGSSASIDTLTAGDVTMTRTAPTLYDITIGALTIMGNSPSSDGILGENWDTDGISVSGCGYYVQAETVSTDSISGSCSNSASPNNIVLGDVDATYTGTLNAIYARNSAVTVGEGSITMPTTFDQMSKASTNGRIVLIDVDQDGTDCESASDCNVTSSSSGAIYFGGLATVKAYKALGGGVKEYKEGHTVQATVVDAGSALFTIGTHKTDSNGEATVWVVTENDAGDTYTNHNLVAYGAAGQNETLVTDPWYPGSFGVGDSIELRLEPAPVSLNGTNMDCDYLRNNNTEAALGYDGTLASGGTNTFTWEGKVTMIGDLNIDDCNVIMKTVFRVASDATISPKLTISSGGSLVFGTTSTSVGTLKASTSSYPLDLDIAGGILALDGGRIMDVSGGINLDSGTLIVENSAIIYGNAQAAATEATVFVNGGTIDWDDSTIQNSGQTGIGLMFEQSAAGEVDNIVVKNAAVGIYSYNAAPTINGFTLNDNDVGLDVYGGMTLPTIYRSTILSGQSTGWTTYAIDLSSYLNDDTDYVQVGYDAIYGGGNAHPRFTGTTKQFMITDRYNVELSDGSSSWNVTTTSTDGYYDGALGGGYDNVGVPSHSCNTYGYSYNPGYWDYSYNKPQGFDWEDNQYSANTYYPMQYWSLFSPAYYGFTGVMAPPEGISGYYNVCSAYASYYSNSPGHGQRFTYPIVDVSGSNITGLTMYVDVLHNRADNYQDRMEILVRSGDDPSDLGNYVRESGTPSINSGTITGAKNGIEIGGMWAAGSFDDITVTNPVNAGLEITGSVSSTVTNLTVSGGAYGALMGAGSSGSLDLIDATITGTTTAGVYYIKNMVGELSASISGGTGAGIKFGSATDKDITYSGMTLTTNGVGIDNGGKGTITMIESDFGNSKDVVITGSGSVDFIEGTVDSTTVEVTGTGVFSRMRHLDVTVEAGGSAVTGANVILKDGSGSPTGSAITDSNGVASDLTFLTETVSVTGLVTESLSGYEAVTVAQVGSYFYTSPTNNAGDFRYSFDAVALTDASGSTHTMNLVNTVDARVCYSYSSTSYEYVRNCPGQSTSGSRTFTSGMIQYGYYGATPQDMSNKVVMLDVGLWYIDGNTDNSLNDSTVLVTGTYNSYDAINVWSTSPYGARMYAHDSNWVSTAVDDNGNPQGIKIGYNGWNDVVPDIQDSTIAGLATIVTTYGYKSTWSSSYVWEADFFNIQNNTFTHFRNTPNTGASQLQDQCLNAGNQGTIIANNVLSNCGVGVSLRRTGFSYAHAQSYWGADDAIIHNNTFKDTSHIDIWFHLSSYTDGVEITDNTMTGTTIPSYGVYAQDRTATDILIEGNTITNSAEPIYLRGALDWNILDNTITGQGDASYAGIYVKDGYGVIDGNVLVDTDGGILIDGIQYGYNANVTNNDLSQTFGRVAPSAIGIWAEDCGSSVVNSGGNKISVMENAIVTDGCDLVDTGSSLDAIGGSGGAVYTVQMNANAYSPTTLNIKEGDTVRWRSNEYYNNSGTGEPHDVTSNATDAGGSPIWSSGGTMNLGSTFTKTFSTAGTYDYHCSVHPWMYASIVVGTGSSGGFVSVGVNVVGTSDEITLDGTSVSGFGTSIEQYGGSMMLKGDTLLSGGDYAAYAEDTDVVVDGAELIADSTGSAMYVTGTSSLDATDMDTSGMYGLNSDAVDFRWNGGNSDATTSLFADGGAEGSVENVTWAGSTTQINAGSYVTVTSVGNTVDAAKLVVDSTAVIHEGNLLDLSITHKGGSASDVGLLIQSTDGEQAAYVSPAYRAPFMSADGDLSEWYGNVKNPSDDAMPGVMSSDDAGEDFLATWDANNLYLALTGVDMGSADLQIYIDSSTGGDTTGDSWYVSHALPFAADYVFWAEDDGAGNSGLKVNGFTGWSDVTSSCSAMSSTIGNTGDTDTEISIPWNCIGEPTSTVRMIVIVQDESTGAIESVHPDQTVTTGAVGQTFNEELTILMGHSDLADGDDLTNHLLIYRSYVGSNTPSDAKTYDISVKVEAACEEDWGNINSVDMSTNVATSVDILRACPVIQDLVDVTVNEDSGAYTLTMLDKADDVQDAENALVWTVADDSDPSRSPTMLLDSTLSSVASTGQVMTITPDNDQFGEYVFHFAVEDSHGLTDSKTITFKVVNVNDAPIICNEERADCMPVFADDGDGNLNVLDEGFGSVSKVLGSAANATGSYVVDMASNDMANEQPQVYSWNAHIKGDDVTVDPYWVQKKYDTVAEMFAEVGAAVTSQGGFQDVDMSGDPASISPNGTYTLPTLNNVSLLTYLLAQNGCGSVWYQEYMDSSGNKVTAVRSDDGCDSTIDANAMVYNSLNYTDFWMEGYGVDVDSFTSTWSTIFPTGYTTTGGYNPCPAFSVSVVNNELSIVENAANELGGECTIVLTLTDDGGYCANTYLGRTTDVRASCVSYTWLIDYDVVHPVYGPMTVTGCYNLYLGLASFVPEYLAPGVPTGMTSDICLAYSWVGENTDAVDYEVNFSVTPVNDAPEVLDWDRQAGVVISDGNGEVPSFPWKVTLTEDDENVDNLTYDLSAMKHDNDHEDVDLEWTIVKSDTCNYENYFSATISGDEIAFDLIKDATTNAPEWEVDYLKNSGIHQKNPLSGEFCPITLYLHDTETAPSYVPNYGMPTANYQQGEDSVTLYVRVDNVAENVPDYFLSDVSGFDFNEVSNIMPKTFVPTTVTIGHGGDQGPYNYEHMLEVTFHSNGYNSEDVTEEGYVNLGTQYVMPPAYGDTLEVTDFVYITATSQRVWVEVDVLTCVGESCDMSASPEDRYFGYSFPYAHSCVDSNGEQGDAWSCPGEVGSSSVDANGNPSAVTLNNKRRPMLEDQDWCNNLMSTDDNGSDCAQPRTFGETTIGTGQELPTVVRLIGTADVPSFAPSIIAISAAGLFVSALVLQSRRDDEEESLEEMILEADEQAVSPVIATILMVAITVVLSGVIYVWASSLADTSAKGVPRMTFDVDSDDGEFHRITVTASQVELATQAMEVTIEYTDATGAIVNGQYNLADTTVYGFYPGNSPSMVTFGDAVGGDNGAVKSSFDTGDTIYIKTIDENGDPIGDIFVSISYVPNTGPGSVLRTWDSL